MKWHLMAPSTLRVAHIRPILNKTSNSTVQHLLFYPLGVLTGNAESVYTISGKNFLNKSKKGGDLVTEIHKACGGTEDSVWSDGDGTNNT